MDKITYRHSTLNDAETIVKWRNQPLIMNNFLSGRAITIDEHVNWFNTYVLTGKTEQFIFEVNNEPFGSFYFKNIDRYNYKAEYGIYIGNLAYHSQGFGTVVTNYALKYAFTQLSLHKVYLYVFLHNISAMQCYRKCGFIQEGLLKDDVLIGEDWYDVIVMAKISPSFIKSHISQ